jgi:ribosomal protein L4
MSLQLEKLELQLTARATFFSQALSQQRKRRLMGYHSQPTKKSDTGSKRAIYRQSS